MLAALSSLACAGGESFLSLPEGTEDEVFFIFAAPSHELNLHGPHRLGALESPLRLEVEEPDDVRFLLVDLGELEAAQPLFDPSSWRELRATMEPEACANGRAVGENTLQIELTDDLARWAHPSDEGPAPKPEGGSVSKLSLKASEERCVDQPRWELAPFGPEANLLPIGTRVQGRTRGTDEADILVLLHVRPLTEGRLIAASVGMLYVFERGQAWSDAPTHSWSTDSLPQPAGRTFWSVRGLVVDHPRSVGDRVAVVIAVSELEADARFLRSFLVSLVWTEAGFEDFQILETLEHEIHFLEIDERGRMLAGGDGGLLLLRETTRDRFVRDVHPEFSGASLRAWSRGFSPEEPDVLLDRGSAIWVGALGSGTEARKESTNLLSFSPRRLVTRETGAGLEGYYTTGSPEISRRTPQGDRDRFTGYLPLGAWPCDTVEVECGRRSFGGAVTSHVERTPWNTLLLMSSACSPVVEVDPARMCSRKIEPRGFAAGPLAGEYIVGSHAHEGGFLLSGREGFVLEARWQ